IEIEQLESILIKKNSGVFKAIYKKQEIYIKIIPLHSKLEIQILSNFIHSPNLLFILNLNHFNALYLSNVGETLNHLIFKKYFIKISYFDFLNLLLKLFNILLEFHSLNYIHFDLSINNITILNNQPFLIDFGISEQTTNGFVTGGFRKGWHGTKAPEIRKNGPPLNHSVDIFSMGIIIRDLLFHCAQFDQYQLKEISQLYKEMIHINPSDRIHTSTIIQNIQSLLDQIP
ncbi:kinase-like domain-containing protein, partial [Globomyces pollinis-pini]